jgi:hypothetical protein
MDGIDIPIPVVHLAGKPCGLVQLCERCGEVLTDSRNIMVIGEWTPSFWREGPVSIYDGNPSMRTAGREPNGVDCVRQSTPC